MSDVGTATAVDGIHKRYGWGPWVLTGVDLLLAPGTVTEVVGGNGSGKSTLLRVLAGLTRPTRGSVRARPASIGFAPERLPERIRMSARTYVAHMAAVRGVGVDAAIDALDRLGLVPGLDASVTALSKGNRQKVVLAQALAAPAGLLLLDEPVGGLDTPAQAALCELVGERRTAGATVLVAAHGPVRGLVVDVALVLDGGVLVARDADEARRRIELVREGRRRVEDLPAAEADVYLAAALAEGWSVVTVRTL